MARRQNCECGASIQLTRDARGHYDQVILDLFDKIHDGEGHSRVTAWEANYLRNYYSRRGNADD